MQSTLPRYALPPLAFPYRHLASLAGRAPIGGAREVALACFLAARLAGDRLLDGLVPDGSRSTRGAGAKGWLSSLSLPAPVRAPLARCLELSATGTPAELAEAVAALASVSSAWLEPAARAELDQLAAQLTG